MRSLLDQIARPQADLSALAARVAKNPALLHEVFSSLNANQARLKFGSLKVLRLISEQAPGALYPKLDRVAQLLDHENTILKWGGIIILGNLAAVDSAKRLDAILPRLLAPIRGPVMITAANCIASVAKLAAAKPYLAPQIAEALLEVESATYQTPECRNVALGHVVVALELFFAQLKEKSPVIEFVTRQTNNPRNAVKKKAAAFLKKHDKCASIKLA